VTEITSWGTLYYSLPVAAASISTTTGWSRGFVVGSFSGGLLLSAVVGIAIGRLLDHIGPRLVMTSGALVGVFGLVLVSLASTRPMFLVGWLVIGVAQSAVLYQPAFITISHWYGKARTRPLAIVTVVAGLASTVFAPITASLIERVGWRTGYLVLAAIYAAVTIPLHALFLTPAWRVPRTRTAFSAARRSVSRSHQFFALQAAMTLTALGVYAVTIDLIPLLTSRGVTPATAATAFGLIGAGQVLGRLVFTAMPRERTPASQTTALGIAATVSLGLLAALPGPTVALIAAAIFVGSIRGAYTLLQATAIADRWGTQHLGTLNGTFAAPITAATALAPVAGTLLAEQLGSYANSTAAFAALVALGAVLSRRT
jgi:predicted MFS family arabinose efflux permease